MLRAHEERGILRLGRQAVQGKIRREGQGFSAPMLKVKGRNRTKLLEGLGRQLAVVREVLVAGGHGDVLVHGVLCFTTGDLPRRKRLSIGEYLVLDLKRLGKQLDADGPMSAPAIEEIARVLAEHYGFALRGSPKPPVRIGRTPAQRFETLNVRSQGFSGVPMANDSPTKAGRLSSAGCSRGVLRDAVQGEADVKGAVSPRSPTLRAPRRDGPRVSKNQLRVQVEAATSARTLTREPQRGCPDAARQGRAQQARAGVHVTVPRRRSYAVFAIKPGSSLKSRSGLRCAQRRARTTRAPRKADGRRLLTARDGRPSSPPEIFPGALSASTLTGRRLGRGQ